MNMRPAKLLTGLIVFTGISTGFAEQPVLVDSLNTKNTTIRKDTVNTNQTETQFSDRLNLVKDISQHWLDYVMIKKKNEIAHEIGGLSNIEVLALLTLDPTTFPPEIQKLVWLKVLDLSDGKDPVEWVNTQTLDSKFKEYINKNVCLLAALNNHHLDGLEDVITNLTVSNDEHDLLLVIRFFSEYRGSFIDKRKLSDKIKNSMTTTTSKPDLMKEFLYYQITGQPINTESAEAIEKIKQELCLNPTRLKKDNVIKVVQIFDHWPSNRENWFHASIKRFESYLRYGDLSKDLKGKVKITGIQKTTTRSNNWEMVTLTANVDNLKIVLEFHRPRSGNVKGDLKEYVKKVIRDADLIAYRGDIANQNMYFTPTVLLSAQSGAIMFFGSCYSVSSIPDFKANAPDIYYIANINVGYGNRNIRIIESLLNTILLNDKLIPFTETELQGIKDITYPGKDEDMLEVYLKYRKGR